MPVLANSASRILSLALLTILVNTQGWSGLLIFALPLLGLFYRHPEPGRQAVRLAKRLRWFFLSILILYLWFYPGTELIPMMGRSSPTEEGINEAVLRITSLLIVISYSVFLVQLTPRDDIICGIQFLLSPLAFLGVDTGRFALRLGLVLSIVPEMMTGQAFSIDRKKIRNLSEIIDQAAIMVNQAGEQKNDFDFKEVAACEHSRPGVTDVLVPLLLLTWLIAARF